MKKIEVESGGQKKIVFTEKIAGELWFHFNGETFQFRPEGELNKSSQQQKNADPSKIISPMPGKIIKILKAVNETINKGETLVIMEAMKMEYNLKASVKSKIKKMNCQENQTVSLGETLIELEPCDG